MSRVGRIAALGSAVLTIVGLAAWWGGALDPSPQRTIAADPVSLFEAKGCSGCHAGPATAGLSRPAPALTDAAAWAGDRRPGLTAADYLAESIRQPSAFISPEYTTVGGPLVGMPDLGLDDAEIDQLVDYLLDRRRADG